MVLASGMPADEISGPCGVAGHLDTRDLYNDDKILVGGNDYVSMSSCAILVYLQQGCRGNLFLLGFLVVIFFPP